MPSLISEDNPRVVQLRAKMEAFYGGYRDYKAFSRPSNVEYAWEKLVPEIRLRVERQGLCRVLEFGAGCTGFPSFLQARGMRGLVRLTLHDVTRLNVEWLEKSGDEVVIGPVSALSGTYDLIFSTFVLEHMTDPKSGLESLWRLVAPGGVLVIVSPRYDFPYYLPPSCDHVSKWTRLNLSTALLWRRITTLLTGRPGFFLLDDLAMFHLGWEQDRDAVHLASHFDLKALFRRPDASISSLKCNEKWSAASWKHWFIRRFLQVCIKITKSGG